MEKRSYTEDLNIDKDSLEIEWEKQPRLFIYWAEREVDAQEERDKAQRNMSVIKAEMDAKVRKDPEKYGIDNGIKEAAVSSAIVNSKEYKEAELKFIEATKNARLLSASVVAFDHKKRALTKLTDLWISGYYGSGGVPKEMKESINKKVDEKVRSRLKNNPRLQRRKD